MESLVKKSYFEGVYTNRKVAITGHTGFKGSWLAYWLKMLGAKVYGFSLGDVSSPNHFDKISDGIFTVKGDIRDKKKVDDFIASFKPEIVFHLAAQPLVRKSYKDPVETYETNVLGTLNVFEACRNSDSVKAIVNVTTDKCYENNEWHWGYRENDRLGGHDIYSSSKACSEILTESYRKSFLSEENGQSQILLASARAGNVIGGGDWAEDRLIPDMVKASVVGEKVLIRSPKAVRPWQHVLEPLGGYLLLGSKLLQGKKEFAQAWNFGPENESTVPVLEVLQIMKKFWDGFDFEIENNANNPHEAGLLKLDCSKALAELNWKPVWNIETCIRNTAEWYKGFYDKNEILTEKQIIEYTNQCAYL